MATIKQIANLAGVSRGTVDRVLNNRGTVNPETAAKVREIAALLNYTPNKLAKTLAVKNRNIKFGYVLFSSTNENPFFDDVVAGIKKKTNELTEYGISVDTCFSELRDPSNQVKLMDQLVDSGINGLAITPINHPDVARKIKELSEKGIPVITVNTDIENSGRLAYVGSNYLESGKTAGGLLRLISGGKANVGIIVGSMDILCHSERVNGFKQALEGYSRDIKIVEIVENYDDDFLSFEVTKKLLNKHPEIDSLYLASAGVYGACRAVKSLNLDKKLKIISFDSVPTTKLLIEDGTIDATITQQPHVQGSKPLSILYDYLVLNISPKNEKYYTNHEIKIRENIN
ncbi:MAG TPA: substrate-binding domain-containing protein [Clostridiaceae bacterium]|jgi:LacI family transcriptional regulator|nr:substrate-binding domain-containing protein [Clostridiaceae bacterium]